MLGWHILIVVLLGLVSMGAALCLWRRASSISRRAMLTLTRHMPDPVLIVDKSGLIIAYSPAACQLFAYQPDEILNLSIETLMPPQFAERHRQIRSAYMREKRGQAMDNEVICLSKTGERIAAITRVRTFSLGNEAYAYVSIQDIRRFKDREAILKNLSEQDPLTGLANRRLFDHDLEREWQRALRGNEPLTLMMIDVDYFKQYNDYYGHPEGDDCLKRIAVIIQNNLQRGTDCVARYGGEEFICLLPSANAKRGQARAQQICDAIDQEKISHQRSPIKSHITVSIGCCTIVPQEGMSSDDLINKADAALYRAKSNGRNQVIVSDTLE